MFTEHADLPGGEEMPFIGHAKSVYCSCKGHTMQQYATVHLLLRKQDMMVAEKTHPPSTAREACMGACGIQIAAASRGRQWSLFSVDFLKGLIYNNTGYDIMAEELFFLTEPRY